LAGNEPSGKRYLRHLIVIGAGKIPGGDRTRRGRAQPGNTSLRGIIERAAEIRRFDAIGVQCRQRDAPNSNKRE
jgi:hypothetical protein